jgi:hypothetical protein
MEEVQRWFQSRAIIAGALGVIATVARAFNLEALAGIDGEAYVEHVYNIAQAVLFATAIYGRAAATKRIV